MTQDESPPPEPAESAAKVVSQQPSSHLVGDTRKKKFAPKVKTGCNTCRVRRVKCDETKPSCKRCLTTGRACVGISYGPSTSKSAPTTDPNPEQSPISRDLTAMRRKLSRIAAERAVYSVKSDLEPFGWDFVEACEYFNRVVHVRRCSKQLIPNDFHHTTEPSTELVYPSPSARFTIITISVAHRIAAVSRMHGQPGTRSDEVSSMSHLWETFYRNISDALQALNADLAQQRPMYIPRALFKIVDILSSEFYLVSTNWRGHIEGFVTLTQLGGGIDKLISAFAMTRLAFYYIMVVSITASATSPSHDQVVGASFFTTADIRNIYSTTIYPSLLCPTHLFLDIARINALRARAAQKLAVAPQSVQDVLKHIDGFSPDNWVESYTIPDNPEITLIARTFHLSVALYGLLTLPYGAKVFLPNLSGAKGVTGKSLRRVVHENLDRLMHKAMRTLSNKESLAWPLAVLGVAAVHGTEENRTFVEESLYEIGQDSNADAGPMQSTSKVHEVWEIRKEELGFMLR